MNLPPMPLQIIKEIHPQDNGTFIIDGSASVRDINKNLGWRLPTSGPKTLNGLIIEALESIPDANVGFRLDNYYFETLQTKGNFIKTALVSKLESHVEKQLH